MGLRDKVRKTVKKRVGGRDERPDNSGASSDMRRRLARLRARAAQLEAQAELPETDEDQRVKDQFRRAEETATVGAPVNATLNPINPPERMAQVTRAETADRDRLEDLATGTGSGRERRDDEPAEIEQMAMLDFGTDRDDRDDRDDGWTIL